MSDRPPPLHQMNPQTRFSDRAEDYAKYRPSYPAAAIDTLLQGWAESAQFVAADVGAGTGISSRLLAERGVQVWAIEPNAAMRQAADPHPGMTFLAASAEETGLPAASVDLVTCFQAFHWVDPDRGLAEFHRILKPGGRLALVWNTRDCTDGFTQGYSELVRHLSNQHPAESRMVVEQPLLVSPLFRNVHQHRFSYQQTMDFEGLVGRAQSVSYLPKDEQAQQQLLSGLQALFEQWMDDRGLVAMTYSTEVFLAEPAAG